MFNGPPKTNAYFIVENHVTIYCKYSIIYFPEEKKFHKFRDQSHLYQQPFLEPSRMTYQKAIIKSPNEK